MCAPLAVRRVRPRLALVALTGAAALHVTMLDGPNASIIAVPVVLYSLARWSGPADARTALAVGLAGSVIGPVRWFAPGLVNPTAGAWATTIAAYAGVVVAFYVAGRRARETAERALAERESVLLAAAAEERTALAREVHDIVAHSLAVIAVQAEGGRAVTAKKPERAPDILAVIADASRGALDELRELVAVLRADGRTVPAPHRPAPGLGDLGELVSRLDGRARLRLAGDRERVGPLAALTIYRLVQESLTNVLRHAGPAARVEVRVHIDAREVLVSVTDDGRGGFPDPAGRGTGLIAMRERVQLHEGLLTAAPRPGGGFEVRAVLPLPGPGAAPG
ncbi:two-component sensor histidine kinase [Paractinoplanes abujensis]|nr:two-component sensor histidine kinase [Actinoplanes abujensis]